MNVLQANRKHGPSFRSRRGEEAFPTTWSRRSTKPQASHVDQRIFGLEDETPPKNLISGMMSDIVFLAMTYFV